MGGGAHLDVGIQRRMLSGGDSEQSTALYEVRKKGKRILGEEYCPVGIVSAQDLKWEGLQCLQVGIRRSL